MGGTTSHPYAVGTSSFGGQNYGGYGGDSGGLLSASCSGPITTTFTWQPAYTGEPGPQDVIVTETGMARATGASYPAQTVGGGCDDGIGQTQSPLTQTPIMGGPYQVGTSGSGFCQGTRYSVTAGGSSVAVSCSPSATASANTASATGSVRYTASISPITIQISGTWDPTHGDFRVLTGQPITASLQGIPTGFTVTSYTWSVGGDAFKTYNENATSNQLVPLSSADLTGPQAGNSGVANLTFYDRAKENLTVSLSANITAPDGTSLSVSAQSPQIVVEKPTVDQWTITEGYVQYKSSQSTPNGNQQAFGLYGSTSGTDGMIWSNVRVSVPAPFVGGRCTFTQLVLPERYGYVGSTATSLDAFNGDLVLDGAFDYGAEWGLPGPPYGSDSDSPSCTVGATGGSMVQGGYDELSISDTFTTWVMYKPAGGVWVPLQKFSWDWSETLNWGSGQWNLTAASPATAGSAPSYTPSNTNDPPQWSQIQN